MNASSHFTENRIYEAKDTVLLLPNLAALIVRLLRESSHGSTDALLLAALRTLTAVARCGTFFHHSEVRLLRHYISPSTTNTEYVQIELADLQLIPWIEQLANSTVAD
jgi:hypothetical protein